MGRSGRLAFAMAIGLGMIAGVETSADAMAEPDVTREFVAASQAAIDGDPHGQFLLGEAYRLGRGAEVDRPIAENWYRRAATQGDQAAARQLGLMLAADQDWRRAILWLTFANAGGDPKTTARLALQEIDGSTEHDRALALELIKQGASVGPLRASLRAEKPQAAVATVRRTEPAPLPRPSIDIAKASHAVSAGHEADGAWLQLGAYATATAAEAAWLQAIRKLPDLRGHRHIVGAAGAVFRLRVSASDKAAAQALSRSLAAVGWASIPARN